MFSVRRPVRYVKLIKIFNSIKNVTKLEDFRCIYEKREGGQSLTILSSYLESQ